MTVTTNSLVTGVLSAVQALVNAAGAFMGITDPNGNKLPVPYALAQSGVPVVLVPNGTVAVDGTITLGTALGATYNTGAWVRLPAGAIVAGLAGLYWCVFSSTTVGSVKTNFADPASQFVAAAPATVGPAAVGSAAAYTQATGAAITLVNATLPAGALGLYGQLHVSPLMSNNNSAGVKTYGMQLSGSGIQGTASTSITQMPDLRIQNRGSAVAQVLNSSFSTPFGTTGNAVIVGNVDTSVNQAVTITGNLATATDWLAVECFVITVSPS